MHALRSTEFGVQRRSAAAMLVLVAIVTLLFPSGSQLFAAPVSGAITSVSVRESTVGLADITTLDLTWAVPDSAVGGDFFTLELPAELIVSPTLTFPLRDPDGNVVANASVSGQVVTFVVTSFVDERFDVTGTAFFESRLNSSVVVAETTIDITFVTDGASFDDQVNVIASRDRTVPNKFLNIPATNGPNGERLLTGISTGIIPAAAVGSVINIVDRPDASQAITCSTLRVELNRIVDNFPQFVRTVRPDEYTATCDATGFSITLTVPAEFSGLAIRPIAWVTIIDDTATTFRNTGEVTIGNVTTPVRAQNRFSVGGGTGVGATTTTTTTTVPEEAATTTVPEQATTTTVPAVTTVPGETTTTSTATTSTATTSTTTTSTTTTTVSAESTTTAVTPSPTALPGPTSPGPVPTVTIPPGLELPATGSTSTGGAWPALVALVSGLVLVAVARRRPETR